MLRKLIFLTQAKIVVLALFKNNTSKEQLGYAAIVARQFLDASIIQNCYNNFNIGD